MDCHLFRLLVQKYRDGELEGAQRAAFESHLAECEECGSFEESFRSVFSALEDLERFEPPDRFNDRVMAHVSTGKYRKSALGRFFVALSWKWSMLPGYVKVTASLAAVFAVFMYVFRPILTFTIGAAERVFALIGSISILLVEADKLIATIANYFKSDPEFILAARLLLRKFQQLGDEIPYFYLMGILLLTLIILFVVARVSRSSWRKGESNVRSI